MTTHTARVTHRGLSAMDRNSFERLSLLMVAWLLPTVANAQLLPYGSDGYRYLITDHGAVPEFSQVGFDSSHWQTGCAPFGSDAGCPTSNNQLIPCTFWPANTDLLLLREFWVPSAEIPSLYVGIMIDNDVEVWFNGVEISDGTMTSEYCSPTDRFIIPIPNDLIVQGINRIAVRAIDRGGSCYADVRLAEGTWACFIRDEPNDAWVAPGGAWSFAVSHSLPVLQYQWYKGTTPLIDSGSISGASTRVVHITNVSGETAGDYSCLITPSPRTGCEPIRSRAARLSCSPLLVDNPHIIGSLTPDTITIEASISVGDPGSYAWLKDGREIEESSLYSGVQTQQLSLAVNTPETLGSYSLRGWNTCGSVTTEPLEIGCLPLITQQPIGGFVPPLGVISLEVIGAFSQSTTFAWHRDGVELQDSAMFDGTHSAVLRVTCLDDDANGGYSAIISNECGTMSTDVANVFVRVPCGADFNQDGGVDGSDIEVFFAAWEAGSSLSDLNEDGGVDGGDLELFFALWQAGGC